MFEPNGEYGLINVNGTLFFKADDGINGPELWKSDGTRDATVIVKDIRIGAGLGSFPESLANANGTLLFAADDGVTGTELWRSDGTEAGTVLVKDIYVGNDDSEPRNFTNVNGTIFFSADDGATGTELWMGATALRLQVGIDPSSGLGILIHLLVLRRTAGSTKRIRQLKSCIHDQWKRDLVLPR